MNSWRGAPISLPLRSSEAIAVGAVLLCLLVALAVGPRGIPTANSLGDAGHLVLMNQKAAPLSEIEDFPVDTSLALSVQPPQIDLSKVEKVVVRAANRVGIEPALMLAVAQQESRLDPDAASSNTTARGLFQFTNTTWMRSILAYGRRHGLDGMATKISLDNRGRVVVSNSASRTEILKLRNDARLSALMAAELMRDNRHRVERHLGRSMKTTGLYLSHFLGVRNGLKFLRAYDQNPDQTAADLLPHVAMKNRSLFYDKNGALSVGEVYALVDVLISGFMDQYPNLPRMASNEVASLQVPY